MTDDQKVLNDIMNVTEMISSYSDEEKKTLADITYWALTQKTITPMNLGNRFNIDQQTAMVMIEFLINRKFLIVSEDKTLVTAEEIPNDLLANLKTFYSDEDIEKASTELPREEKTERSALLSNTEYVWNDAQEHVPERDDVVAIRVVNRNKIITESNVEIEYIEGVYLARYIGSEWKIEPPYLAYDLGGLTDGAKVCISDDNKVAVTHWANIKDDEIERWQSRFSLLSDCDSVIFKIDKKHERDAYEYLTIAARMIYNNIISMKQSAFKDKLVEVYKLLSDLQSVIDLGGEYHAVDNKE